MSADNAWDIVYVYTMGSEVERIIRAVQHPSEEGAAALRSVTNDDASAVLAQIKSLVETV